MVETKKRRNTNMKKSLIAVAAAAALTLALSTSAFAHSGDHARGNSSTYRTCAIASCVKTGNHKHNGKTYAAHKDGDGHSYHGTNHTESHATHANEGAGHH
jgi:hypothetical protein